MQNSVSFNRRQWLGSVGAALAGFLVARRLPGAVLAKSDGAPAALPRKKSERRYVHGFEVYPAA